MDTEIDTLSSITRDHQERCGLQERFEYLHVNPQGALSRPDKSALTEVSIRLISGVAEE